MSTSCNLVVDKRQFGIRNHDLQRTECRCNHNFGDRTSNSGGLVQAIGDLHRLWYHSNEFWKIHCQISVFENLIATHPLTACRICWIPDILYLE